MDTINKQLKMMNQKTKELASIYHHKANELGISDGEFWVWYALLVLEGEFSQQDICDIWSYPKQTVHSIILNMNKKGYIYLDTIPKTKNRKIIRLTKLGKQHGAQVINEIRNIELNTIAQLSVEERNQCIYLLEKYVTILKGEMNKYESKSNIKL